MAKASTKEISESEKPQTFEENKVVANRGGKVAGDARKSIETQTGKPVITSKNAAQLNEVIVKAIEAIVADDDEK